MKHALLFPVLLLLMVLSTVGCASQLETHVRAAHVTRTVLDGAHDIIVEEAQAACEEPCEPFTTALNAHRAAAEAHDIWVAAIGDAAADTMDWGEVLHYAIRVVRLYDAIAATLRGHDVDLPVLPDIVLDLAGVGGGE